MHRRCTGNKISNEPNVKENIFVFIQRNKHYFDEKTFVLRSKNCRVVTEILSPHKCNECTSVFKMFQRIRRKKKNTTGLDNNCRVDFMTSMEKDEKIKQLRKKYENAKKRANYHKSRKCVESPTFLPCEEIIGMKTQIEIILKKLQDVVETETEQNQISHLRQLVKNLFLENNQKIYDVEFLLKTWIWAEKCGKNTWDLLKQDMLLPGRTTLYNFGEKLNIRNCTGCDINYLLRWKAMYEDFLKKMNENDGKKKKHKIIKYVFYQTETKTFQMKKAISLKTSQMKKAISLRQKVTILKRIFMGC